MTASVDPLPGLAGRVATGGRLNVARLLGGVVAPVPDPPASPPPPPAAPAADAKAKG